ncbi:MAG: hypothetical protein IAB82_00180 [Bacteroidetes bacterium]|uniref:DUF3868 domain-containing protein n=1 Tax=Candidatus Cryptobacteroides faecavium TaxID=2840762 RepID=A0A9D9ICQ7_9BACT|nr:hypothetical protein [Candidatus Cryptobacteroides faecavium]
MKNKMTVTIATSILFLSCATSAGNVKIDDGPVRIGHAEISHVHMELGDDDSVRISFTLKTVKKGLPADRTFVVRPQATNSGTTKALRTFRIERPYKELKDRRSDILSGSRPRVSETGAIYLKAGESIFYTETWAYEPWMEHLELETLSWYEGCCDKQTGLEGTPLTSSQQIYFPPVYYSPKISEIPVPKFLIEEMAEKNSFISASQEDGADRSAALAFQFRQGSSYLDPNLSDNRKRMSLVEDALKAISENPDVRLRKVIMTGYASVEGSRELNERLATERARSVLAGIDAKVRPENSIVEIICGGEDWDDLLRQVQKDTLTPMRDSVLNILTGEPDMEARKVRLKGLGEAYTYLLEEIFPRQRSAGYLQLFFDVINRSDINQRIAIRFNEAADAASSGNYDKALEILEKRDLPLPEAESYNLRGVCFWKKGDTALAEEYFMKALELKPDMEEAADNLEMLREWDKYHHLEEVEIIRKQH